MFHAPSQDSNLKTKGLTPCGFFAVQCFQRVDIWLPSLDSNLRLFGSAALPGLSGGEHFPIVG